MNTESHNSFKNPTPQTTRLIEVLEVLERQMKKQNSLRYAFYKGVLYGFGTVVGATILVALFGGVIASTLNIIAGDVETSELLGN
jgi:hypothetical protein